MKKFVLSYLLITLFCASAYAALTVRPEVLKQQYFQHDEEIPREDDDVVVVYPTEDERKYVQVSHIPGPNFQNIPKQNPNEQWQNNKQRCLETQAISGECYGYIERWTYNALTGKCQPFVYGGCGGNGNNFVNRIECEYTCEAPEHFSRPRSSPVNDFMKSIMSKLNAIPNWIQERFGKRRLDSVRLDKNDNVVESSENVPITKEGSVEDNNVKEECWIPIFCEMQMKVQKWFQGRQIFPRRFGIERPPMKQMVPKFGKRRL